MPPISASAVVEVVGYLTPEERREEAFQEFMAWFRQDLQRFLKAQGGGFPDPASHLTADRPGGNPMPRHATLLRIAF